MIRQPFQEKVVVRGAGEMASGVINRLSLAGFKVLALEQDHPTCVRRYVCYAEAIYEGQVTLQGVTARKAENLHEAKEMLADGIVPILVDPDAQSLKRFKPSVLIDGRLLKHHIDSSINLAPVVIGLGPGFVAGKNCHAAVETHRGKDLGKVIYKGSPQVNTGIPAPIKGITIDRVLRSPAHGPLRCHRQIGDIVKAGDRIASVAGQSVFSRIDGIVRGLARDGLRVTRGQKIGDIDPRGIRENCFRISDKAQAIAEGVIEAMTHLLKKKGIILSQERFSKFSLEIE